MTIYDAIKQTITARDAAEVYGLELDRTGMCCCPFHPDHHPSMKVDRRFHCFGCGADGDVINLVAKMYGLSNGEAAKKLAQDFSIPLPKKSVKKSSSKKILPGFTPGKATPMDSKKLSASSARFLRSQKTRKQNSLIRQVVQAKQLEEACMSFYRIIADYYHLLLKWKNDHAPRSPDDPWDDCICEALRNLSTVEYLIDSWLDADLQGKVELLILYGKVVLNYEQRIQYSKCN